jgi:RimJ/RimL family protein N-acetyltransferase
MGAPEGWGVRLDCGCCVLRPWREGDEPSLVRHADNREVSRRLRDASPTPTPARTPNGGSLSQKRQDPQTQFAIEVDGEAAGGIGLEPGSDIERRTAEIGYWLGEAVWGRGIATAAVRAVTGYGFEALDLTRVFAVPVREQFRVDTRPGEVRVRSRGARCAGARLKRVS